MALGIETWEGAGPKTERTEKWHPTRTEMETIAQFAVLEGMSAQGIAMRMDKTVEQVRYQLSKPEVQGMVDAFREEALDKAGFAMAQLQIALPDSVNDLIAIARNSAHAKQLEAIKFHLELALAPRLKQPEQQVNVTLNVTQQAASVFSEQLPRLSAERGEQKVEHPSNNAHLHFGEKVAESQKATLE